MYRINDSVDLSLVRNYFKDNVLSDNNFFCKYACECENSYLYLMDGSKDSSRKFHKGQLHHIGKHYGLSCQGSAFRVMVVGQEYGHDDPDSPHVDFDKRYDMIMDSGEYRDRNPHMRGTTSLLRLLHGLPLGKDHEGEFIEINGQDVHLFDTFALVNYLLCSAVQENSRTGCSTFVMKKNCQEHFIKAVGYLKPTVLIVQGKRFWDYPIKDIFKECLEQVDDNIYRAGFNGNDMIIGTFSHPSARGNYNWGNNDSTSYLVNTVSPTVSKIREMVFKQETGTL